ncbi:MAG: DNA-processing protein DprA [Alphaproteobacteria bacterium]|nr:DNA-processing protein DprA [Alphaproteobacteria bacterium]
MTLFPQKTYTEHTPSCLSDAEKLNWIRLIRTENVGPVTFYQLLSRFGSAGEALNALPSLSRKGGRQKNLTPAPMDACEQEWETLKKAGGDFIFASEADYPIPLGACEDAPPVLSLLGHRRYLRGNCIGMVGARNASLNGRKLAEKLARELGQSGQVVVSGLARGIDTAVHQGALMTGTIAVVAGGIDVIYPPENATLYAQIKEMGAIVAESPWGMEPLARHFPRRNRIISGLSSGVVVVEATLKSGSLITARTAAEQGRDVYAVPGSPLDPRAEGPNKLLQDGAILVTSAQDILKNITSFSGHGLSEPKTFAWINKDPDPLPDLPNLPDLDEDTARARLLENLSQIPLGVDELLRTCHVSIPVLQSLLLELELAGRIQRLPGNRVVLVS